MEHCMNKTQNNEGSSGSCGSIELDSLSSGVHGSKNGRLSCENENGTHDVVYKQGGTIESSTETGSDTDVLGRGTDYSLLGASPTRVGEDRDHTKQGQTLNSVGNSGNGGMGSITTLVATRSAVHDLKARELLPSYLHKYIVLRCSFTDHCSISDFDEAAMDALQRMAFLQALQTVEHFTASVSPRIQKRSAYLMGILRGQEAHWDNSRASEELPGGAQQLLNMPPQVLLLIAQCCLEGNSLPSDFTPEVCLSLHSLTHPLTMKSISAFNSNKRIIAGCRGGVVNRARFFQRLIQNVMEQSANSLPLNGFMPTPISKLSAGSISPSVPSAGQFAVPPNTQQSSFQSQLVSDMFQTRVNTPTKPNVALMTNTHEATTFPPGLQRFCTAPAQNQQTIAAQQDGNGMMKRYHTDAAAGYAQFDVDRGLVDRLVDLDVSFEADSSRGAKMHRQFSDSSYETQRHIVESERGLKKHNTSAGISFTMQEFDSSFEEALHGKPSMTTLTSGRRESGVHADGSFLTDTTALTPPNSHSVRSRASNANSFVQSPGTEFSLFDFTDLPSPTASDGSKMNSVPYLEDKIKHLLVEVANAKEREERYKYELQTVKQALFNMQTECNNLKRLLNDPMGNFGNFNQRR